MVKKKPETLLENAAYKWLGCGKFPVYFDITLSFIVVALAARNLDSRFDD